MVCYRSSNSANMIIRHHQATLKNLSWQHSRLFLQSSNNLFRFRLYCTHRWRNSWSSFNDITRTSIHTSPPPLKEIVPPKQFICVQRYTDIFTAYCTPMHPWHHCISQMPLKHNFPTYSYMSNMAPPHSHMDPMISLNKPSSVSTTTQQVPTAPTKTSYGDYSNMDQREYNSIELPLPHLQ